MNKQGNIILSSLLITTFTIILVLFILLMCGSVARAEDRALKAICGVGDGRIEARIVRNGRRRFNTGDLLLMAFHFPPWSLSDTIYKITESFTGVSFTHAGVVVEDTGGELLGIPNMMYAYEYDLNSGSPKLRPLVSRLRRFLPNRVVVRRVGSPVTDYRGLMAHIRKSGACDEKEMIQKKHANSKKKIPLKDGVKFISRMVRRYVLEQNVRDDVGNPTNCVDTAIDALVASGQWQGEAPKHAMQPSNLLHGQFEQLPMMEQPELLVGAPEWALLLDAECMGIVEYEDEDYGL